MNKEFITNKINESKKSSNSFCEFLFSFLEDEIVEIYTGDAFEEVHLDQNSFNYSAVFVGKFIGAYGECIILDSISIDQKTKDVKSGNIVIIHEKAIKAVNIADNNGNLQDAIVSSKKVNDIAYHFKNKK